MHPGTLSRRVEMASSEGRETYGHAEDGLFALVNITLGHDEGCAGNRCDNEKKERRWRSVKKEHRR